MNENIHVFNEESECFTSHEKQENDNRIFSSVQRFSNVTNERETSNKIALDIGNYVGTNVNNFIKRELLLNHWVPPKNYVFPYSVHNKKGKEEKRYANQKHLDSFDWFIFSDEKKDFIVNIAHFS